MPFRHLLPSKYAHSAKAAVLVGLGLGWSARRSLDGSLRVLTFHGLGDKTHDREGAPLDDSLHLPVETFEAICQHLVEKYKVLSLMEAVAALRDSRPLPSNAVAISFDDGYASNYHLALPILQACGIPATIFLTTAFIDGDDSLWFQRADWALAQTPLKQACLSIGSREFSLSLESHPSRQRALEAIIPELKRLPWDDLLASLDRIEETLGVARPSPRELPPPMRPMNWDQIREMHVTGFVDFGAHTHRHPIMARCEPACLTHEIHTCRDRMEAELGRRPQLFAYPNGGIEDFDADCEAILREAGFIASFSTVPEPADGGSSLLSLPRFGSPESVIEAEATVSGAFTLASRIKNQILPGKE